LSIRFNHLFFAFADRYHIVVRVQADRFEDNGMAVLLPYPEGGRSFDAPRELLPRKAKPGDVLEVSFVHDRRETERMADENRRLMDELLRRDG
jgi:Protein of unknown function (DUF3006)